MSTGTCLEKGEYEWALKQIIILFSVRLYINLTDFLVACIVLRRNCILLLQRASFKDVDRAGLVAERLAAIPEQWE